MWSKTMKKACLELIFSRTANLELAILLKMSYSQVNFIGFNKKFCITYFFRTLFSGWSWWCIQDVSYFHVFCMFFYMLFSHVCAFYVFLQVHKHIKDQMWGNAKHMQNVFASLNLNFWWTLLTVLQIFSL